MMSESIEDRLAECLRWGVATINSARETPSLWFEPASSEIEPFDKMLAEAALLALLADRALGPHPGVAELLAAVVDCDEALDRTYEIVRWRPYLWTSAGAIWVFLDRLGAGDPQKRARLRGLWDAPVTEPRERVPYRLLDQAWIRTVAGCGPDPRLASAGLRSTTSLGNLGGALHMGVRDLYAITHAAMYLTDFGALGRTAAAPGWIGPLAAARLLVGDLDLAAELALTDALTGVEPAPGAMAAATGLGTIFDRLGFVPSPSYREAEHQGSDTPDGYLYLHTYHSTFVYGLLCAVLITLGEGDGALARCAVATTATFPPEWHGERAGISALSERIVHTHDVWAGLGCPVDGLLRTVLDAYLIDAHQIDAGRRTPEVLAMLGMRSVAGPSPVDQAVRDLLATRVRLGGDPWLAQRLIEA